MSDSSWIEYRQQRAAEGHEIARIVWIQYKGSRYMSELIVDHEDKSRRQYRLTDTGRSHADYENGRCGVYNGMVVRGDELGVAK